MHHPSIIHFFAFLRRISRQLQELKQFSGREYYDLSNFRTEYEEEFCSDSDETFFRRLQESTRNPSNEPILE